MRKRWKWFAAGGLFSLTVAATVFWARHDEPRYNGRSLYQWLHTPALAPSPHSFGLSPEALAAIRNMGTNAIPTALRWISYEPSTLRQQAQPLARRIPQRFWPSLLSRNYHLAMDAETVFYILGPTAEPAIPQLTRLALNAKGDAREGRCARALAAIGPQALSALTTIIDNPQTKDRRYVVERLTDFGGPAVPVLIKYLQDPDRHVAGMSALLLGCMNLSNSTVIPALVANLQSTNASHRGSAAAALGRLGPDARPAIPQLVQTLSDPDTNVASQAAMTLHDIDPQTFTNSPWL